MYKIEKSTPEITRVVFDHYGTTTTFTASGDIPFISLDNHPVTAQVVSPARPIEGVPDRILVLTNGDFHPRGAQLTKLLQAIDSRWGITDACLGAIMLGAIVPHSGGLSASYAAEFDLFNGFANRLCSLTNSFRVEYALEESTAPADHPFTVREDDGH